MMVFFNYPIGGGKRLCGEQRHFESLIGASCHYLNRPISVVAETQIKIIIIDRRAGTIGTTDTLWVGSKSIGMMVKFNHREWRVHKNKMKRIGEITQTAPSPGHKLTINQNAPFLKTVSRRCLPDEMPEGEDLPGTNNQPIDARTSKSNIMSLVDLQTMIPATWMLLKRR